MRMMSMQLLLGHWLALETLNDPLCHAQARLLQRFALVMLLQHQKPDLTPTMIGIAIIGRPLRNSAPS